MMSLVALRIFALIALGPVALWVWRPFNKFSMPWHVTLISGIVGRGLGPLSGKLLKGSLVNKFKLLIQNFSFIKTISNEGIIRLQ